MKVTVAFAVVVYCVLGYFCGLSDALKCYECTSATSNDCADPFSTSKSEDNCSMCGKTKITIGGSEVLQRTCLPKTQGISTGCTSGS
ncbi:hypothetical protein MAR_033743, partial [Mya arenaria]